jgi:hypothetical protein
VQAGLIGALIWGAKALENRETEEVSFVKQSVTNLACILPPLWCSGHQWHAFFWCWRLYFLK